MNKKIVFGEIIGLLFAIVAGTLLHFTFAWSGGSSFIGSFSAVNESVWEHLKLAFFPILIWGIAEWFIIGRNIKNFWLAKLASALSAPLIIVILFYGYVSVIGRNFLAADISIFIISVIIGTIIDISILRMKEAPEWSNGLFAVIIAFFALVFIAFTFTPPKLPIFKDPVSGGYGIDFSFD